MKITTAIAQLEKERQFLGIGFLEVLQDIQKHGRMVYSEKTMQAFGVFMDEVKRKSRMGESNRNF